VEDTGGAFDANGNLFVTNFQADSVSEFDKDGNLAAANFYPHVEAEAELLSLPRFGWISTAERAALYESANQTRLSGSVRVERDHTAAG
jgi:hypothetical protein